MASVRVQTRAWNPLEQKGKDKVASVAKEFHLRVAAQTNHVPAREVSFWDFTTFVLSSNNAADVKAASQQLTWPLFTHKKLFE